MLPQERVTPLDEEAAALREENARLWEENSALPAQLDAAQAQPTVLQARVARKQQAPGPGDEQRQRQFRPDIEGLRGLAILLVVIYHVGIEQVSGGFVGVDVFFVLSGYLISGLILREIAQTGRLDFREFYARRARRLLPGAAVLLLATLLLAWLLYSPLEIPLLTETLRAAALYFSNFHFAANAVDYLGGQDTADPLLHTWSLGVEEQFYLVWPLLLVGLSALGAALRRPRMVVVGGMALVTLLSFGACVWLTGESQPWAFYGTPTRVWEFGLGGLAALAPAGWGGRLLRNGLPALFGLLMVAGAGLSYSTASLFPGYLALLPAAGSALLLMGGATYPQGLAPRVLGLAPLRVLGRYSYAWYLWHWPFIIFFNFVHPSKELTDDAGAALAALLCAVVTTHLVEQPIRFNRALLPRPRLSLGLCVGMTAAVALLATGLHSYAGWQPMTPQQQAFTIAENDMQPDPRFGCLRPLDDLAPDPNCVFGNTSSPRTAVLFGDSHALQWFPTVEYVAKAKGWRLVGMGKAACPPHSVPQLFSWALHRIYDECAIWRENALAQIAALHPEVVIMSNIAAYVGSSTPIHTVTAAEWRSGLEKTTAMITAAGGTAVIIADQPGADFNITQCLARAQTAPLKVRDCVFPNSALDPSINKDVDQAVMAGLGPGHYINLNEWICDTPICEGERDGMLIYRDSNHLTATFAATLGPYLLDKINAVQPPLP